MTERNPNRQRGGALLPRRRAGCLLVIEIREKNVKKAGHFAGVANDLSRQPDLLVIGEEHQADPAFGCWSVKGNGRTVVQDYWCCSALGYDCVAAHSIAIAAFLPIDLPPKADPYRVTPTGS